jgi:hypothetical protein
MWKWLGWWSVDRDAMRQESRGIGALGIVEEVVVPSLTISSKLSPWRPIRGADEPKSICPKILGRELAGEGQIGVVLPRLEESAWDGHSQPWSEPAVRHELAGFEVRADERGAGEVFD